MPAPLLIDRLRLERSYGVRDVGDLVDQDADTTSAIQEGSDVAWGILLRGFSAEDLIALCANDSAVQGSIASIVIDILARRRKEFRLPDGRTIYSADRKLAEAYLCEVTDGHRRTVAEKVANVPPTSMMNDPTRRPKKSVLSGGGF